MTKLRTLTALVSTLSVAIPLLVTAPAAAAGKGPLKVYILAGQSNMEGHARVSTFEHIGMDPKTAPLLDDMLTPEGSPRVLEKVTIASIIGSELNQEKVGTLAVGYGAQKHGPKIGPEYTFGIYMHKRRREPFLIIKTAWGGKSLKYDFRPPGAGEWTPPPGHPDRIKRDPAPLPVPETLELPANYKPGRDYLNPYTRHLGFFLFKGLRGCSIGERNGVHPIYIVQDIKHTENPEDFPLKKGDAIVGIEGEGLRENPKIHWRSVVYGEVTQSDWRLTVARWRDGRIESVDIDLAEFAFPGGRADLPKHRERKAQERIARQQNEGRYYRLMMAYVRKVLGDIERVHPAYDPAEGYEIAGFVWFQGWNDMIDSGAYPNRDKPRGYERYSWLLRHFIRDVRKDLDAPGMPFVIGAIGVGGFQDPPVNNMGYLQQAMAAPAGDPEFRGNVAVVQTGKFWDHQLAAAAKKAAKISMKRRELQAKNGLEGEELERALAEYAATVWTAEEKKLYTAGRSNKSFHYLGSAKILGQIGKGFAEAMHRLQSGGKN